MLRRVLLSLALCPTLLVGQTPLADAEAALGAGQPWLASQLLNPTLSVSTRDSRSLIVGAQAAAGWRGWATVRSLLLGAPWLDTLYDRLGHRLLAEASLGEQQLQQALLYARAAIVTGDGRRERLEQGKRFLVLARAQDRLNQLDSAASNYRRAAALIPQITDWLLLRAAGLTRDSVDRAALYQQITLPAALPRIQWTEALALERSQSWQASAALYQKLGSPVRALKARARGDSTEAARQNSREAAVALISSLNANDTRDIVEWLGPQALALDRARLLVVARAAAAVGRSELATTLYGRASREGTLSDSDLLSYAGSFAAMRSWPEAEKLYGEISSAKYAGEAAYYRARTMIRAGAITRGRTALQEVVTRFPGDNFAAGTATYLMGDLLLDAGKPDSARQFFRQVVERYPASSFRSRALVVAAVIAYENGDPATAARELQDGLKTQPPSGLERDAWYYWLGRSQLALGDPGAGATFRTLIAAGPDNYYAIQAARQLDSLPWALPLGEISQIPSDLVPLFQRVELLESLSMDVEAEFELNLLSTQTGNVTVLTRTAQALSAAGYPGRAQQLAQKVLATGIKRDGILLRLLYPLPYIEPLREHARRVGLDPYLAAAVIRQESAFNPRAVSPANALGLMQVMPSLGESLAKSIGLKNFDPAMLFVPDVNLAFGTGHLAEGLNKYPERERALAAYNAGRTPVDQWSTSLLGGAILRQISDPLPDVDMFVERIPYTETRDYVRKVMQNYNMYRLLYAEAR